MQRLLLSVYAIAIKEIHHILRDRLMLGLLISVPLVQILLFGFAIDLHPKALPTAVVAYENNAFVDRAVNELEAIGYFKVVAKTNQLLEAERWLAASKIQFILKLPKHLAQKILREEPINIQLISDATDPVASIVATQAAKFRYSEIDSEVNRNNQPTSIQLSVENRFNPDGDSQLFVIPGVLGVVLTLSLVLLGALSIVREREQGSIETLALLPISKSALLIGKVLPYFVLGVILFLLLLNICLLMTGLSWVLISPVLVIGALFFIIANLAIGLAISLLARNQMQAMQLSIFFYLPSMLLSGFMFPFHGMPAWAKVIGECLPLTHFLRIVRGTLLKGLDGIDAWLVMSPMIAFAILYSLLALLLSKKFLK